MQAQSSFNRSGRNLRYKSPPTTPRCICPSSPAGRRCNRSWGQCLYTPVLRRYRKDHWSSARTPGCNSHPSTARCICPSRPAGRRCRPIRAEARLRRVAASTANVAITIHPRLVALAPLRLLSTRVVGSRWFIRTYIAGVIVLIGVIVVIGIIGVIDLTGVIAMVS